MLHNNNDGKCIIVICPDYDEWGYSPSEDIPPFSIAPDGRIDNEDICDQGGKPIVMPELYEWQKDLERKDYLISYLFNNQNSNNTTNSVS